MSDPASPRVDPGGPADRPPAMPHWVKVLLAVLAVLVVLLVIGKITGLGGEHGPGRHQADAAPADPAPADAALPVAAAELRR